ncbi:hypothetical protein D2V17_00345 [Aurantiacibacter xanthus]|uniref:Uncharacterized protein n=1 Tax=Aurantiacibacter xanthus TaxID=1784712 RepID=A0A3A1PHQ8_9SPHN|nr:hypothetical protein [Aurantiacibacter xanthus]RIV93446.1 hypothetical protein D2V17_00345 [Aurantiacibacter xanthus]
MTAISKALARGTIATVAAGAMAVAAASPAAAQDRYRHNDRDRGGLSTGEIIAGVAVLGGLAAVLASSRNNRDRDYRYDDRRGWNDYQRGADRAINQCVRAAERQARRWSGSRAEVTDIRDIDRNRRGFEVKGRIAVRDDYRGRGWDRAGYRGRNDRWDEGRFTCRVRDGRVVDIDFRGIRGL